MVGINARIHDGNDDGRIAQRGVPALLCPNELRSPLRDVAVLGSWIRRGVIGIIRDEHRLHDIVERHRLDAGLLLEACHQTTQWLSARVDKIQRIVVTLLYKGEPLLRTCQGQLVPGVDRSRRVSMRVCGHDGAEALDAVLAANDVEGRESCRRRIHVFGRYPEVCARLRCKLHK